MDPESRKIDINQASPRPGLGPGLAERIIAYREAHGPFQDISQLSAVQGISAGRVQAIASRITASVESSDIQDFEVRIVEEESIEEKPVDALDDMEGVSEVGEPDLTAEDAKEVPEGEGSVSGIEGLEAVGGKEAVVEQHELSEIADEGREPVAEVHEEESTTAQELIAEPDDLEQISIGGELIVEPEDGEQISTTDDLVEESEDSEQVADAEDEAVLEDVEIIFDEEEPGSEDDGIEAVVEEDDSVDEVPETEAVEEIGESISEFEEEYPEVVKEPMVASPPQTAVIQPPGPSGRAGCALRSILVGALIGALLGAAISLSILSFLNDTLRFTSKEVTGDLEQEVNKELDTGRQDRVTLTSQLESLQDQFAGISKTVSELELVKVSCAVALEESQVNVADLERMIQAVDGRIEELSTAAEDFNAFLEGLRLLLTELEGPEATARATPVPSLEPSSSPPGETATRSSPPTRTPRPTATPLGVLNATATP